MALNPEVRAKLQARIDELKKRMQYDANDLDYHQFCVCIYMPNKHKNRLSLL